MNIRFTKNNIYFCQVILLVIAATTGAFLKYIMPNSFMQILFLLVPGILAFCFFFNQYISIGVTEVYFMFMIIIMLRGGYLLNENHLELFLILDLLLFMIVSKKTNNWIKIVINVLFVMYSIYMVCTIWFFFDSRTYLGYIVNLFPENRSKLIEWYNSGCMAGLTSHYSTNGMFLALGFILSACHIIDAEGKKKKYMYIYTICMAIALLLTGKRAHILFAIISLFCVYYAYKVNDKKRLLKAAGILVSIFVSGMILYIFFPKLATFMTRFEETAETGDMILGRGVFWQLAIELFLENPIMGIGWGKFSSTAERVLNYSAYAHNVYLQLLCETGIVGFMIFLLWFLHNIYISVKYLKIIRKNSATNSKIEYYIAISLAIQLFFLLYCFTGNPLYDKEMYVPYYMACAISNYYYVREKNE